MIAPDRRNLRLSLLVACLLLGSTLAMLATGHPAAATIALLASVAVVIGVLTELIHGDR